MKTGFSQHSSQWVTLLVCREERSLNQSHCHGRVLPPWPRREGGTWSQSWEPAGLSPREVVVLFPGLAPPWLSDLHGVLHAMSWVISLLFPIDSVPSPSQASLQNASKSHMQKNLLLAGCMAMTGHNQSSCAPKHRNLAAFLPLPSALHQGCVLLALQGNRFSSV